MKAIDTNTFYPTETILTVSRRLQHILKEFFQSLNGSSVSVSSFFSLCFQVFFLFHKLLLIVYAAFVCKSFTSIHHTYISNLITHCYQDIACKERKNKFFLLSDPFFRINYCLDLKKKTKMFSRTLKFQIYSTLVPAVHITIYFDFLCPGSGKRRLCDENKMIVLS